MPFRFLTSGESHGPALTTIVEGLPSGCPIEIQKINAELRLRQQGYGRSNRMKIEKDEVRILSGIQNQKTIGAPITFQITNKDHENFLKLPKRKLSAPRPGHADLAGTLKYQHSDIRNTLERASARETAIRTAVGALCQNFLETFGISFLSTVTQIGKIKTPPLKDLWKYKNKIEDSSMLVPHPTLEKKFISEIKKHQKQRETVGGCFQVRVKGVPLGLGSYSQWDLRLDGRLSQALMSIPAIKGVEIGTGFLAASLTGSECHDEIFYNGKNKQKFGFFRKTNHHGGIEGGISTGEEIILTCAMKPLPTVPRKKLKTVDIYSHEKAKSFSQRTDSCAVPAASIVAKNMAAIEITRAFLEKFGGDSLKEIQKNYKNYLSLKLK